MFSSRLDKRQFIRFLSFVYASSSALALAVGFFLLFGHGFGFGFDYGFGCCFDYGFGCCFDSGWSRRLRCIYHILPSTFKIQKFKFPTKTLTLAQSIIHTQQWDWSFFRCTFCCSLLVGATLSLQPELYGFRLR